MPKGKTLVSWKARDGVDSSTRFEISEAGVSRITGRGWRVTREVGRALGYVVFIGSMLTGRSGSSAYGPVSNMLGSEPNDKQFMSWKSLQKAVVDKKRGTISLYDKKGTEIRLCCTLETFDAALRMVGEHTSNVQDHNAAES